MKRPLVLALLTLSTSASAKPARPARPMTAEEVTQVSALVAPATVVAAQSFVVDVRGSQRSFAPGLLSGHYVHHEGIAGSGALERLEDRSWPATAIEAVAFDDVTRDRLPDALVLIRFTDSAGQPFTAARVFRRTEYGGRGAGALYSALVVGESWAARPQSVKICLANSNQEHSPALVR